MLAASAPPMVIRSAPGLLLNDAPRARLRRACPRQMSDELGPLNPGLDRDQTPLEVEIDDAIEIREIDEQPARAELLATHRVPAAADAQSEPHFPRRPDGGLQVGDGCRPNHLRDPRAIELRVNVVDRPRPAGGRQERLRGCRWCRRKCLESRRDGLSGHATTIGPRPRASPEADVKNAEITGPARPNAQKQAEN